MNERTRLQQPDDTGPPAPDVAPQHEAYTHGHGDRLLRYLSGRTAEREADHLLPHLRPGMRLLDVGCGVGSITLGLAVAVAPGEAVGIDLEPAVIERARALADEHGTTNVRFEVGSIYALPFADGSFDAAFSRSVLEHLGRPLAALREVRRVLRPGGVLGVVDGDFGGHVFTPPDPLVAEAVALYLRAWVHNGGNPQRGREHWALLREAGFGRIDASAGTADVDGTPAATRTFGDGVADLLTQPSFVEQAGQAGWADARHLDRLAAAFRAWGGHPDAYWAVLLCKALGWAAEDRPGAPS